MPQLDYSGLAVRWKPGLAWRCGELSADNVFSKGTFPGSQRQLLRPLCLIQWKPWTAPRDRR